MKEKVFYSWGEFYHDCEKLILKLKRKKFDSIVVITRGGLCLSGVLSQKLNIKDIHVISADSYKLNNKKKSKLIIKNIPEIVNRNILLVDDVVDSGETLKTVKSFLIKKNKVTTAVLHWKSFQKPIIKPDYVISDENKWIVYPWEEEYKNKEINNPEQAITLILKHIGENPNREGLVDTPRRVIKMYDELFSGYNKNPKNLFNAVFTNSYDELIIIKDINFTSICEHHMVPFMGKVHIGYVPNGKVLGLSKFARLVEIYARRLQIQEQMTEQITDDIWKYLKPKGVMVVVEAEHMCMSIRGIKKQGHKTITSGVKGRFRKEINPREEMLKLL